MARGFRKLVRLLWDKAHSLRHPIAAGRVGGAFANLRVRVGKGDPGLLVADASPLHPHLNPLT